MTHAGSGESGPPATLPAVAGGVPVRAKDRFLVFGAPVLGDEEMQAVADSMRKRWIGAGPKVARFEAAFAAYKGAPHAVAVSSCSAALHLSLLALGIGAGDEVISPSMTFCAALNSIVHVSALPVLVDCDVHSMNVMAAFEAAITPRTKAIIIVHFGGRSCAMDDIMAVARSHGVMVIEDCAHAIETSYRGTPAGLIGDVGCFSFHSTKNLTTVEGGMVITRNQALADKVRILAQQGMSNDAWSRFSAHGYRHYQVTEAGFKYNMTDVQAAIGLCQLARLADNHQRRAHIWARYQSQLADLPCLLPPPATAGDVHGLHLFAILLDHERLRITRDEVLDALTAENIGVGVHYRPLHLSPYYQANFARAGDAFPNAQYIGERTLSLPMSADLRDADVDDVCCALRRIFEYYGR